ncbi:MAG: extracellular solute-binding protein [Chloroflexota bacterium]
MNPKNIFFLLLTTLVLGTKNSAQAQAASLVLTVGFPEQQFNYIDDRLFADFEASHPGVDVVAVNLGSDPDFLTPEYEIDKYLDSLGQYTKIADVLYINPQILTPEATHAGYFLDLAPLVNADQDLHSEDYYPALWKAFAWDNKVWALPASASVRLLHYIPGALDAAGLSYPDAHWTVNDFANATSKLVTRDTSGAVKLSGFYAADVSLFFRSLLGKNVADDTVYPSAPQLVDPQLVEMLNTWVQLQRAGQFQFDPPDFGNGVALKIPLDTYELSYTPNREGITPYQGALLAGDSAGFYVEGYAVSSATDFPELAYELTKYITSSIDIMMRLPTEVVAKRAAYDVTRSEYSLPGNESEQWIQRALNANALTATDMRFMGYVRKAYFQMVDQNIDAQTALQNMQLEVLNNLKTADARTGEQAAVVNEPPPTPILAPNKIELRFNLLTPANPPLSQWQAVADEFAAQDAQVGSVSLSNQSLAPSEYPTRFDCFYAANNQLPFLDSQTILSVDPLLDADPNFSRQDALPGSLAQLTRDGKIWGVPLTLHPQIVWYDAETFSRQNLPPPEPGWSIMAFNAALETLDTGADNRPVLTLSSGRTSTQLLMLIAAYDGLPFDFRTNPLTINLDSAENIEALRSVFDLIKQGVVDYDLTFGGELDVPLYDDTLGLYVQNQRTAYQLTTFPQGDYIPAAYDVGAAFISAAAQNPEACYRWISTLALHPELFTGMPARASQLTNPAFLASQSLEANDFYQYFASSLRDPRTMVFPLTTDDSDNSAGVFLVQWLNQALARYIKSEADFDTVLNQLRSNASAFMTCIAAAPSPTYSEYRKCALAVDPILENS